MFSDVNTREYYAKWLGIDPYTLDETGVYWIYNAVRNEKPLGYPGAIDMFAFITQKTIIVSYGNKAADKIPELKSKITLGMDLKRIHAILEEVYLSRPNHNIKYIYKNINKCDGIAKKLMKSDYALYLDFFKKVNPGCQDTSWVEEYFFEIAAKGYSHGIVIDGQLASATDAPDMPFMSDKVQEIGINTLPTYQGKGYGTSACLSCINEMFRINISPQWSTSIDNIASQKLANSVGFEKYFDNLSICL